MTEAEKQELEALRDALMFGLRVELPRANPGYAAFERHQLLAIRFHRASRLNAPGATEGAGWRQYFAEHFPRGDEHALRLWEDWRGRLVKDEFPGERVVVSHGQPRPHWKLVEPRQRLYINLESMWDDFSQSVDSLVELLSRDQGRREATLAKWRKRQWTVQQVAYTEPVTTTASMASTFSVASSSAWQQPPEKPKPDSDADSAQ